MTKVSFPMLSITSAVLLLVSGILGGAPRPARASSGDYVTGTVTTAQSKPAPSMWVMVYDGAVLKGRTLTGNDGRYFVGGLVEKTYTIVVRKQISGSNLASKTITLPQDRLCNLKLP